MKMNMMMCQNVAGRNVAGQGFMAGAVAINGGVGVMELRAELAAMLVPVVLAAVPVTVLVMAASGLTTQTLARALSRRGGQAQTAAQTQEEPRHE